MLLLLIIIIIILLKAASHRKNIVTVTRHARAFLDKNEIASPTSLNLSVIQKKKNIMRYFLGNYSYTHYILAIVHAFVALMNRRKIKIKILFYKNLHTYICIYIFFYLFFKHSTHNIDVSVYLKVHYHSHESYKVLLSTMLYSRRLVLSFYLATIFKSFVQHYFFCFFFILRLLLCTLQFIFLSSSLKNFRNYPSCFQELNKNSKFYKNKIRYYNKRKKIIFTYLNLFIHFILFYKSKIIIINNIFH